MNSIYKAGALIIKNKKLLLVREKNEDFFIYPGGRIEKNEKPEETLKRELKEELEITPNKISFFDTIITTFGNTPFKLEAYFVESNDKIEPASEIEECRWVDSSFKKEDIKLAEDIKNIMIPRLFKMGLIE